MKREPKRKEQIKKRIRSHKIRRLVALFLLVAATCVLVYPSFADALSDMKQIIVIGGLSDSLSMLSEEEIFGLKEEAQHYNDLIWRSQQSRYFHYEGEEYDDELYDAILRTSPASAIMAYVEIPKTGAYLPIVHGTKASDLTYQAGHMHGTSVPIGGINTHCVISAHTGLESATLFTGIDKLKQGDQVYIHVLNEIHVYTVRKSNTVLPGEADFYLQIEEGKDLITLYTCTPYGINSHRLLVTCERTGDLDPSAVSGRNNIDSRSIEALIRVILWVLIPAGLLAAGLILIFSRKGRRLLDKLFRVTTGEFKQFTDGRRRT